MKTRILYSFLTILMTLTVSHLLVAQQGSIEHDSDTDDPTLELIETQVSDYSRLFMTNSNVSNSRFSLAARHFSVNDADFGLFYNGSYRLFYEEDNKIMTVRPNFRVQSFLDDEPDLEFDIDNDNVANISFVDNFANPELGTIKAFSQQNGTAIPSHISFIRNARATGAPANVMTMWDDFTTFGDEEIVGGGAARVVIHHNSSGDDGNLRLVEDNLTDYARLIFQNQGSSI